MGGWLNPSILFIMIIKNLLLAGGCMLMPMTNARTPTRNTTANAIEKGAITITTETTPVSDPLDSNAIYYIKDANDLILDNNTVKLRGYQYTYKEDDNVYQYIDYYVKTTTNWSNIQEVEYLFTGNIQNYTSSVVIEEYEYGSTTDTTTVNAINNFLNGSNSTIYLSQLRNGSYLNHIITDAGDTYWKQNESQIYQYARFRLQITIEESQTIADGVASTQYLYTQLNYSIAQQIQVNPVNYEVIDIPGLMFEILGMPFAWMSIAFNLTLFPGTPYAINISHIFFALIGSLILIIILKKVLK